MRLIITDQASQAIIKELGLKAGDGVKFFARQIPGQKVNHDHKQGYAKDNYPDRPIIHVKKDEIDYHINFEDAWFFGSHDCLIDYDQKEGVIVTFPDAPDGISSASIDYDRFLQ
ncbi:MAG TPA: Fe-S cluster assembly protein HesB [Candidatus Limosilactobacillus faecipullorum]|nr:Fe-S cluster assembly protein HesB [Candidatus Limosilactobacillus faecipullorum]